MKWFTTSIRYQQIWILEVFHEMGYYETTTLPITSAKRKIFFTDKPVCILPLEVPAVPVLSKWTSLCVAGPSI